MCPLIDPTDTAELDLDPGIAPIVRYLEDKGIDTFESCEGGPGHMFQFPMVRFTGDLIKYTEAFNYLRHINAPMVYTKRMKFAGYPPSAPVHGVKDFWEIEFEYPLPDFSHLDGEDSIHAGYGRNQEEDYG